MRIVTPVRLGPVSRNLVGLLLLIGAASVSGGQAIPATAPTSPVPVSLIAATPAPPAPARYRAQVIVDGTRMEIRANNSSLNGILRTLSDQTGLKISGGVLDQRVFGTYGPGPVDQVLSALLEDTGTNMILRQTSSGGLGELILSPRLGGPSPPSPSAVREEAEEGQMKPMVRMPAAQARPSLQPAQQPQIPQVGVAQPAMPSASTEPVRTPVTPDPQGIAEPPIASSSTQPGNPVSPTTQPAGATDNTSGRAAPSTPDAPKTPQQIYEELQKLHQQQPQGNQ